jgi:hypothetical protein
MDCERMLLLRGVVYLVPVLVRVPLFHEEFRVRVPLE